jgi:hypothetical protein
MLTRALTALRRACVTGRDAQTVTVRLDSPKSFSRAASREGFRRVRGGRYVPRCEVPR